MRISDIVSRNAKYFRDCDAVIVPDEATYSWADLEARSNALARALLALGLRKGDRLAALLPNCVEFFDFFYACAKTGIIGAPANIRLTAAELGAYFRYVEPAAMLAHARLADTVRRFLPEVPSLRHVIGVGAAHGLPLDAAALRAAQPTTDPGCDVTPDDVFQLAATSGTTGIPKGAVTTHRNAFTGIMTYLGEFGAGERGTHIQAGPMFFNPGGPNAISPVHLKGGRSVLMDPFDPGRFLEYVERYRATHTNMAPTLLRMILDHPDCGRHDYSSIRVIGSGGSPVPEALLVRARAVFGDVVIPIYGMAETVSCGLVLRRENLVTGGSPEAQRRLTAAGKPMVGIRVRVVADDGADVPEDNQTAGEICLKGDSVSREYFRMPDETAASRSDGWFRSGDVAVVDAEGFVTIVDRKKDVINTGGIKVFSRDVEEALYQHPDVVLAAAVGIPHPKWGEAIHASVVLRPDSKARVEDLLEFAATRLADFKKPRSLEIVEHLPVSATGKILKKELRAMLKERR